MRPQNLQLGCRKSDRRFYSQRLLAFTNKAIRSWNLKFWYQVKEVKRKNPIPEERKEQTPKRATDNAFFVRSNNFTSPMSSMFFHQIGIPILTGWLDKLGGLIGLLARNRQNRYQKMWSRCFASSLAKTFHQLYGSGMLGKEEANGTISSLEDNKWYICVKNRGIKLEIVLMWKGGITRTNRRKSRNKSDRNQNFW